MATVPGDLIRLRWANGECTVVDLALHPDCGVSWPPPPRLQFWDTSWFERTAMSALSDEEAMAAAGHHVVRGAEYSQVVGDFGPEATCIGCGCTDSHACAGGCHWLAVDREGRRGVCSSCPEQMARWESLL